MRAKHRDRTTLPPGTVVKYTSAFLRSIGWYTNVPRNGIVVEPDPNAPESWVYVMWCDSDEPKPVNAANLFIAKHRDISGD